MNQNIENLVHSLTNFVNEAKGGGGGRRGGGLRSFGEGNCSEKNGTPSKPSCSVNDSLKKLYPSTKKAVVKVVWGWKAKWSKSASSSYPTYKEKFTETLQDVFLISGTSVTTVPRRSSQQFYCKNGFVATAVQFDSSMDGEDVYKQIRKRFCKYKDSQFEFLKALDDDLVKPGVEKVDYKTMKHIIGQGSAYLSLDRNFSLIMNMILMKMILNRKVAVSIAPWSSLLIKLPPPSSKMATSSPVQSELKVCPICFKQSPA